jgi:GNAT superfamily N-acetyltransferase
VRPGQRGSGLGTRLLAAAEEEIARRSCDRVALSTHSFQVPGLSVITMIMMHRAAGRRYARAVSGNAAWHLVSPGTQADLDGQVTEC